VTRQERIARVAQSLVDLEDRQLALVEDLVAQLNPPPVNPIAGRPGSISGRSGAPPAPERLVSPLWISASTRYGKPTVGTGGTVHCGLTSWRLRCGVLRVFASAYGTVTTIATSEATQPGFLPTPSMHGFRAAAR